MSQSFNCHCPERNKPIEKRAWFVTQRNYRCSAFDGYRQQYSEYSTVNCGLCPACGRTKAKFVDALPDAPKSWAFRGGRMTRAELDAELAKEKATQPPTK